MPACTHTHTHAHHTHIASSQSLANIPHCPFFVIVLAVAFFWGWGNFCEYFIMSLEFFLGFPVIVSSMNLYLPTFDLFLTCFPDFKRTYLRPTFHLFWAFRGFGAFSMFADPQDLWQKCPGHWWNHDRKSWNFSINFWEFLGTWWAYGRDFQDIDGIMTENPGNDDRRMTNSRGDCRFDTDGIE